MGLIELMQRFGRVGSFGVLYMKIQKSLCDSVQGANANKGPMRRSEESGWEPQKIFHMREHT